VPGVADTLIDDFDEEVDSVSGVVLDGKPARPLYALLTHDGVTDMLMIISSDHPTRRVWQLEMPEWRDTRSMCMVPGGTW
jgi:hypothetical protein